MAINKKNKNIYKSQISDQINKYLSKIIKGQIPLNKSLLELGLLDSLELVKFISYIQKKWDINLTDREMSDPKIYNLSNLENIILKKIKK
jgi:acyl carrier protein|tara:strand:- start:1325 stop:1594 length:270 start_codon:yes stop_codon:yes gene_type:complete